jgi:dihydrofolate reductase
MRKLIVSNIISLDGCFEGPGHDVMALPMDASFDAHNAERMRAASTLLFGRRTYELFRSFWPGFGDNPKATADHREIARRNDVIEKVVVSDGLTLDETVPWASTTRVVRRTEAHRRIAELKRGEGGDILIFGSGTLWNDLLGAGLVDELHLMIGNVVLPGGTPAFTGGAPALRLLDSRSTAGSSNILIRYRVEPKLPQP